MAIQGIQDHVFSSHCPISALSSSPSSKLNGQWCYRKLLKIKRTDRTTNEEVLHQIKENELYLLKSISSQKTAFEGRTHGRVE